MTVSFVVSRNNIKTLAETREELSIGSGASATVVIDDPIAAREHVVLKSAHGGLVAVPLETSTGTYLNGVPIDQESALGSTDVLVIGTTRVTVHLDSGQKPLGARVDIEEKVSTLFDQSDPDRWVHDEVSFGRFASTRTMVWLSAFLGLG
ncbi:MAG: FHA domain-containing protein, partial [Planctomycetota bacterium]